jgi:hypothetical protein
MFVGEQASQHFGCLGCCRRRLPARAVCTRPRLWLLCLCAAASRLLCKTIRALGQLLLWPSELRHLCATTNNARLLADTGGYHVGAERFSPTTRDEALAIVRAKFPLSTQLAGSAWNVLGPMAWLNAAFVAVAMPFLVSVPAAEDTVFVVTPLTLVKYFLLFFVGDFGLYWGHRIQHVFQVLWTKLHSFHHQVGTPSPATTIFIDSTDATLQGGLPMLFAAVVVQPHPLLFAIYVGARVSENAVNHCGAWSVVVSAK